jgi:putative membrane protein
MNTRTRGWLEAAVLLLMGIYFFETLLTGEITYYIAPQFNWLAVMAGIFLFALGITRVARMLNQPPHLQVPMVEDSTKRSGKGPFALLIFSIPLVLGIFLPARPLGATAISGGGIVTSLKGVSGSVNAFTIAPESRNVLDWVRAFNQSADPAEFNGQGASLLGFVYRDIRFDDTKQFMITRFAVQCCVADAIALGVIVETPDSVKWEQDQWVLVKGRMAVRDFDGQPTPVLVAESIETTTMPDKPYLFQ